MNPGRSSRFVVSIVTLCALVQIAFAQITISPWQIHHPHPSDTPRSITHDGTKYVLADSYGHIFTSLSGRNWTHQPTPELNPISSITFAAETFVAVGEAGWILYSTNGTNWLVASSPTTNDLSKVTFAQDRFIAVGSSGTILSSTNGHHFELHNSGVTNNLLDLAEGAGTLVIAGESSMMLVSTNITQWKMALVTSTNELRTVAYFKGRFHAGWFSTEDPMIWTNNVPHKRPYSSIRSVAATTNVIARILDGTVEFSSDGSTWRQHITARYNWRLESVRDRLYMVGYLGIYFTDPRNLFFSPMHLSMLNHTDTHQSRRIAATTNGFIASTFLGSPYFQSTDGDIWQLHPKLELNVDTSDLLHAAPPYARVSNPWASSPLEMSNDRTNWQSIARRPESYLFHAAALGSNTVVSSYSNLWVTSNLTNWTKILTKLGRPVYVSEGDGYTYMTYTRWITSINARSNLLAATTCWGELLFSNNGIDWEIHQTPFSSLEDCTFTDSGILVTYGMLIAEANFGNTPHPERNFSFSITGDDVSFHGPLRHYELQSSADFTNWATFQITSTNTTFDLFPTHGHQFFRAVAPH